MEKRGKKVVVWILRKRMFLVAILFLFSSLFMRIGSAKSAPYIERISGSERIETAIQISQTGWESAGNVILARADNPADALSSASLSGSMDAPILLTNPNTLQQNVIDEIHRLNASTIYILGGTGAVSGVIESKLKSLGLHVKRLGGPTRFETAAIINNEAKTSFNTKAIVVSGYATADALSAASNSANHLIPIYLSTQTTLPVNLPANVKEVTIYGGVGVVGSGVESLLTHKGIKVTRISGMDRYETNIKSADENLAQNVIIVRGTSTNSKFEDYPDAVAGAGLSKKLNANIILSHPTDAIPITLGYFENHHFANVYVLGGVGAVSDDVIDCYTAFPDSKINKIIDFTPVAADVDPLKPVVYMLNDNDNTINSYNYETKELKSLKLSGRPEELYVRNNKVYVTIVDKPHSDWDNDQQSGSIDIVDGENFQLVKNIRINIDPFDIIVDNNGVMYISSGSGQMTFIKSYSSDTGTELSSMSIRQQSYLEMNPNQTTIYSNETDSTPNDITKYSIQDGKLVSLQTSSLHGAYELGGFLKMSPDGLYLFNNARNVFNGDLKYVGSLENQYNDITFNLDQNRFFTGVENVLMEHNYSNFEITKYYLTNGQVIQTYYKNGKVIILSLVTISETTGLKKYSIETLDVPVNR